MSKPVLLVDVDGVLNVFGYGIRVELEDQFTADGYEIRVPRGTRKRIARLEELFDCTWATTWEDRAVSVLAPEFGFGAGWPVMQFNEGRNSLARTWKLPTVQKWHAREGRPFAWIDDDLGPDVTEFKNGLKDPGEFLPVRIVFTEGLADDHVEELERFAGRFQ